MINHELVRKTEEFLKLKYDNAIYLNKHPEAKAYRIEHSYRVANIGREIAVKEGFDETEMVIACLLHDVAYCEEFGEDGWKEHGRRSAQIARPFLTSLGFLKTASVISATASPFTWMKKRISPVRTHLSLSRWGMRTTSIVLMPTAFTKR